MDSVQPRRHVRSDLHFILLSGDVDGSVCEQQARPDVEGIPVPGTAYAGCGSDVLHEEHGHWLYLLIHFMASLALRFVGKAMYKSKLEAIKA